MKNLGIINLNKAGRCYIVSVRAKRVGSDKYGRFYYAIARDAYTLHHYLVPSATLAYKFEHLEDINPKVIYNHLKKDISNYIEIVPNTMAYHEISINLPILMEVD